MSTDNSLPLLLTVSETATLLRTTRKAVYAMIERGLLPGVTRIGRRVLVRSGDSARIPRPQTRAVATGVQAMSVTIRPYRRGGWEADIRLRLPNGRRYRERGKAPGTSRSAAQRWAEDRERHLLLHGPQPKPQSAKEVPTLKEFATTRSGGARGSQSTEAEHRCRQGVDSPNASLAGAREQEARRDQERRRTAPEGHVAEKGDEDGEQRADDSERVAEEGRRMGSDRRPCRARSRSCQSFEKRHRSTTSTRTSVWSKQRASRAGGLT